MPRTVGAMTSRITRCVHLGRHHRRRRVGAHAAGVGAAVAVEDALVVLARGERQHVLAVHHHDEARLLACPGIPRSRRGGPPRPACCPPASCRWRRAPRRGWRPPPRPCRRRARRPSPRSGARVRVDVGRAPLSASVNVAWPAVGMPWRAMKRLAKSLDDSSCAAACGRPEDAQLRVAERIHDARGERRLRGPPPSRATPSFAAKRTSVGDGVDVHVVARRPRARCRRCRARRRRARRAASGRGATRAHARGRRNR